MLGEVVREAAKRFGDTPAFVREDGDVLTYAALDRLSDELACGLARRGVGVGDVVSLLARSGTGYVIAYAACAKVGAITAGVNERLSAREQAACVATARPVLVIAERDDAGAGAGSAGAGAGGGAGDSAREVLALADLPHTDVLSIDSGAPSEHIFEDIRVVGGTPPHIEDAPDRPVAIVFTSGTTGLPKGAVFCSRQLDTIGEVDGGRRFGGGGRGLGSTSMAHLATMTKLPQSLRGGGTTFLMRRWSAGAALEMVERHGITTLGGIPTQVALMLRHPSFESTDRSSVRIIALGGGASAPSLVREARERFGIPVVVRYTCTEAGVGTGTAVDDPPEDAEETVGRARGGIEVSIRDPETGVVLAASGGVGVGGSSGAGGGGVNGASGHDPDVVGEVCLRSGAVMAGYYEDPVASAAIFTEDGAIRTGDLGWLDERGRLHLCGRAKEMYVRGGYNVFPLEVESVLSEHPAVAHVAIAPRPDVVMGEIGVAVVVVREGFASPGIDELRKHAEGRLAHHKLPEALMLVDELPRTAMEKVDRRVLSKLVAYGDGPSAPPAPPAPPEMS